MSEFCVVKEFIFFRVKRQSAAERERKNQVVEKNYY